MDEKRYFYSSSTERQVIKPVQYGDGQQEKTREKWSDKEIEIDNAKQICI